ncbi:hypothetical protein DL95DRAFT_462899 [Leptodontidium sp. 2 PMI_412]|nr:hypothetical protein DL95DRAFT_462899 [Leptodontidium sp. 2 PMI_412]
MDISSVRCTTKPLHSAVSRVRVCGNDAVAPGIRPKRFFSPQLPNELWDKIFSRLAIRDVRAVRATSKQWAAIGARHLFPFFRLSLGRQDFERLEMVVDYKEFVAGVKALYLETGKMGIYCISDILSIMISNGPWSTQTARELIRTNTAPALAEYASWNITAHQNTDKFRDVVLLKLVFESLEALESVHITRRSSSLENYLLGYAWCLAPKANYFNRSISEFHALLLALVGSRSRIRTLCHDQLPVTFFAFDTNVLKSLAVPLQGLRYLHLTFDATEPPRKVFWVGLGHFLRSIPKLQELNLGFSPVFGKRKNGGSWEDCDEILDWYVPLWKVFNSFTWENMKTIGLSRMVFCEAGLLEFLGRHTTTLRSLELSNVGLWQGSFRRILVKLKSTLALSSFNFWGHFKSFDTPGDEWRLRPQFSPWQAAWREATAIMLGALLSSTFSDDGSDQENAQDLVSKKVETFMVKGGTWPVELGQLPSDSDIKDQPAFDRMRIDQSWDEQAGAENKDRWELGWDDDIDANGNEILEQYDADGYDEYGFNIEGYNRNGVFHSRVPVPGDATGRQVSRATNKRRILRRIKDQIPRLDQVRIGA